jgi:hypothetical protein
MGMLFTLLNFATIGMARFSNSTNVIPYMARNTDNMLATRLKKTSDEILNIRINVKTKEQMFIKANILAGDVLNK